MLLRLALLAGIVATGGVLAVSPAQALSMKDCSVKYKAAQQAGTLNGMKWNDFRKAECGPDATMTSSAASDAQEPTAANTTNAREPAPPTTAAPGGVVFPQAVNPKYSSLSAGRARM
jgi:hypothetical protein